MSKLFGALAMVALVLGATSAAARAEATGICITKESPAILVHVSGLKSHQGMVRVQVYGGDPQHYFDKGSYIKRIDLPASNASEICVPVPSPGSYAVSVRHDINGNGKSDMSDGGGMSGNPEVSVLDLLFKRKPDPQKVQIRVDNGMVPVSVVMNYVQGGAFQPLRSAQR